MLGKLKGGSPFNTSRRISSPPKTSKTRGSDVSIESTDSVQLTQAKVPTKSRSLGLTAKLLTVGMAATALAGCFGGGASSAATTQQLQDPQVAELVQPANPFELIRMKDGSIAIDADLKHDDAYVLANGAAIRQDGGIDISKRTDENSTLCEQAQALGGTCVDSETVIVSDPNGNLVIETFAREGDPIHRIEAKPSDGISAGGVELNKLPSGTEVFSDNGSGLLTHDGDLQQYPGF